jgi:hypothetical protein
MKCEFSDSALLIVLLLALVACTLHDTLPLLWQNAVSVHVVFMIYNFRKFGIFLIKSISLQTLDF